MTISGGTVFLLAVTLTATALLWTSRAREEAVLVGTAFVGGQITNMLLKLAFDRPRPPFHDPALSLDSPSFPSGHATGSAAVYGALMIVLLRNLATGRARVVSVAGLVPLVALIGFSRIYLGAHYLSDVLAGLALGTWLMVSVLALTVYRAQRQVRRAERAHRPGTGSGLAAQHVRPELE